MDEKINGSEDSLLKDEGVFNEQDPKNEEIESTPEATPEREAESVEENASANNLESESVSEADLKSEGEADAEPESVSEGACDTVVRKNLEDVKGREPVQYAYKWDYTTQSEYNAKAKAKDSKRGALIYAVVISSVFAVAFLMLALFVIFGGSVSPTIAYNGTASVASVVSQQMLPSTILISTGTNYGSGFVISEDGYAVTNHHVISSAISDGEVQVEFYNGKRYKATIVGSSENDDLALIKIKGSGFIPSKIGKSSELVIGEDVVAIGNPGGTAYPFTVTGGIVSALDRDLKIVDSSNVYQRTVKAIQFSAPVNSGNSGGPLINKNGEVIGVVSMKSNSSYEGIGFALPIDESMIIIEEIMKNGDADGIDSPLSSKRPMLGITAVGVKANTWYIFDNNQIKKIEEAELENYPDAFKTGHTGVLVTDVSAGTGAYGKLQKDDIILKINGTTVTDVQTISYVLMDARAGDTVEVDFARGDEMMNVKITLS